MQRASKRSSEYVTLPDLDVRLALRVNRRARRITLRFDAASGMVTLVLPSKRDLTDGVRFARTQVSWLRKHLARQPTRVPFADGSVVPFQGVPHTVRHRQEVCGGVWRHEHQLLVGGTVLGLPARLTSWLRHQARIELHVRAEQYASILGRRVGRIWIRDPKSQWGSCSKSGNLSFSWRLILAPIEVLDYVAAHEATHLVSFGHGKVFRSTLDSLCPHVRSAEAWLAAQGHKLHRYG